MSHYNSILLLKKFSFRNLPESHGGSWVVQKTICFLWILLTVHYVAVHHSSNCATATVDDDINQISEIFTIFITVTWVKIEYSQSCLPPKTIIFWLRSFLRTPSIWQHLHQYSWRCSELGTCLGEYLNLVLSPEKYDCETTPQGIFKAIMVRVEILFIKKG